MKTIIKKSLKITIFLSLALLPFISVTQIITMETFLDSFENPEYYICFQNDNNLLKSTANEDDYIIIQKSNHPDFNIEKNENIIYIQDKGGLSCNIVHHYTSIGSIRRYYIKEENNQISNYPIYESQVIGKIVKTVDNNLWNSIAVKTWEISINELNINAIFSE